MSKMQTLGYWVHLSLASPLISLRGVWISSVLLCNLRAGFMLRPQNVALA